MAIINNSKNFVFIHVPKAAGTSVTNTLAKYTTYKDLELGGTPFGEAIQPAYRKRFGLCKHSPASVIRKDMGDKEWEIKFTFSFVRNPYDRVISTYKFLLKWSGTPEQLKKQLSNFKDINSYVLSDMWEKSPGHDFIFKPQAFWLTDVNDRNKVIVDFVGKVETLSSDLAKIISKIEGRKIEHIEIPVLNKTEGAYELSHESIEKINCVYSKDFTFWNYNKR